MESLGQAAIQAPHWTQRSASMTASSSSQNQSLPGASSMPFISSRILYPAMSGPPSLEGGSQLGVRESPRPLVERLAVAPFGTVAGEQVGQRLGYLVDRPGPLDPVDERGVGAEAATEPDIDRLHNLVVAVGGLAPEADVGDLGLGAGGRAAREVHPHDAVAGLLGPEPAVQLTGPGGRRGLGLDDREAAELVAGAGHHSPLERARAGRMGGQQRLGQ